MHCPQLKNLVLSSSFHKLPDPYREDLKIECFEEMREAPKIAKDVVAPLLKAHIKHVVHNLLHNNVAGEASIQQICEAIYSSTISYFFSLTIL